MIKLVEIFPCRPKSTTTLSRRDVIENNKYSLRELYINPEKIVLMKDWDKPEDSVFPEGLDERQLFSYIEVDAGMHNKSVTVVGRPKEILNKIHENI
tara:strand:- start:20 stop:310 length:291 start_codon:yes stop_codon:yes gene_type:complete